MPARRTRRIGVLLLASLIAGAGLLGSAGDAAAQQGWTGIPLDLATTSSGVQAGMDAAGNAIVVWREPGSRILARRFSAANATWDEPVLISQGTLLSPLWLEVHHAGNATLALSGSSGIFYSNYSVLSRTWSVPQLGRYIVWSSCTIRFTGTPLWTSACGRYSAMLYTLHWSFGDVYSVYNEGISAPGLIHDATGNAMAVWAQSNFATRETGLRSAHYIEGIGWGPPATAAVGTHPVGSGLAADGAGNVLGVWQIAELPPVRAARFDRATFSWGPVTDLSTVAAASDPRVAADVSGNGAAIWEWQDGDTTRLQAARYDASRDAWCGPIDLTPPGRQAGSPSLGFDGYGNLTATWWEGDGARSVIRAARVSTTGATTLSDVVTLDQPEAHPILTVDRGGRALIFWVRADGESGTLQVAQWDPAPAAPAITFIAAGGGRLAVEFTPPATPEPAFAPTFYEFSVDDGQTWHTADPPSNVSPVVIRNLPGPGPYPVRLRAVSLGGRGAPSAVYIAAMEYAPQAPTQLRVTAQTGHQITLRWVPPGGSEVTNYVLQGGTLPGQVETGIATDSVLPTFTFTAPAGVHYVRVHALSGVGWSPPSNEIRIFVDEPRPPSPPVRLGATVNGTEVTLSWVNTFEGGLPKGLLLKVAGSTIASLPMSEAFAVTNVPPGRYSVQMVAVNEWGESQPTGISVVVSSTCAGPLRAPEDFTATTSGRRYDFAWAPPSGGQAVAGYAVDISGSHVDGFTTSARVLSGEAPTGTYTVRVRAFNSCGVGEPTFARTIFIP